MNPLPWLAVSSIVWGGALCAAALLLQRNSNLSGRMRQWIWRGAMILLVAPWLATPVVSMLGLGLAPGEPVGAAAAEEAAPLMASVAATLDQTSPVAAWVVREDNGWMPRGLSLFETILLVVMLGWVVRFVLAQLSARTLMGIVANSETAGAGAARQALEAWSARLKLRLQPELRFAPSSVSPFSYGILRPVIVLPEGLEHQLDPKALDLVVGHECLHVARGDGWLRPLERIVADVMWFNPFAWVMRREADIARELAVDEGVVAISDSRRAYARALRDVAGLAIGLPRSLPAASMSLAGSGRSLVLRVQRTLALATRKPARSGVAIATALGIAGACTSVGQAMLVTPVFKSEVMDADEAPAAMIYAPMQMRVTAAKSAGPNGETRFSLKSTANTGSNAHCELKVSAIRDAGVAEGDMIEEGALIGRAIPGRRAMDIAYCDFDDVALKRLAVGAAPAPGNVDGDAIPGVRVAPRPSKPVVKANPTPIALPQDAPLSSPAPMPRPRTAAIDPPAPLYAPMKMRVGRVEQDGKGMTVALESLVAEGINEGCQISATGMTDVQVRTGQTVEQGALVGTRNVGSQRHLKCGMSFEQAMLLEGNPDLVAAEKAMKVMKIPASRISLAVTPAPASPSAPPATARPAAPATSYAPAAPAQDAEYWRQQHRLRTEPDYQSADPLRTQYQPQVERPPILFKLLDGKPVINGSARLSSGYGYRIDPFTSREAFHSGVDIAAAFGTPVHAPTAGTVTFAGVRDDHGRTVDVAMPDGSILRFSHLNDISVAVGAKIASGSQVGTVGMDGQSTGAHLHFEVIRDGKAINPASVGDLVMIGPA